VENTDEIEECQNKWRHHVGKIQSHRLCKAALLYKPPEKMNPYHLVKRWASQFTHKGVNAHYVMPIVRNMDADPELLINFHDSLVILLLLLLSALRHLLQGYLLGQCIYCFSSIVERDMLHLIVICHSEMMQCLG
jgi:hypothetical protein